MATFKYQRTLNDVQANAALKSISEDFLIAFGHINSFYFLYPSKIMAFLFLNKKKKVKSGSNKTILSD